MKEAEHQTTDVFVRELFTPELLELFADMAQELESRQGLDDVDHIMECVLPLFKNYSHEAIVIALAEMLNVYIVQRNSPEHRML